MALGTSIKMYLMLFVATTCVYMVLYQYNINREAMSSPELLMKSKLMPADAAKQAASAQIATGSLAKRYNIFLWSPLSLMTSVSHSSSSRHSSAVASLPPSSSSSMTTTLEPPLAVASMSTSPSSSSSSSSTSSSSSSPASSSSSSSSSSTSSLASALPAPSLLQVKPVKSSLASNKTSTRHFVGPLGPISSVKNITKTTTTTTTTTNTTSTTTTTKSSNKNINNNAMNMINIKNNNNTHAINTTTTTTKATTRTRTATATKLAFAAARTPPPLYIITPTYRRPEQTAELTRLGYTLKHVVNLLWLVIEDANKTSPLVTNTLDRIGVPYEYLVAPMPEEYKNTKKAKPRGVSNRNRGLAWLRQNASEGVFYFADDDNTYDISIFEQMRYTKKVSMWPVGLVTKFGVSSPIIRKGKIDGFYDGWIGGRKYPVDMAGFAVSVKFLHERPDAKMPFKPGYEEDGFLKSLAPLNNTEIELLASECTEILTWHTQTKKNQAAQPLNRTKYGDTNLVGIDKNLIRT